MKSDGGERGIRNLDAFVESVSCRFIVAIIAIPARVAVPHCPRRCTTRHGRMKDDLRKPVYPAILLDRGLSMNKASQDRALKNYRDRLRRRGISRFDVLGLSADRELIRSLAKQLAANSTDAPRIRAAVRGAISSKPGQKGGILQALRRSPLVGADLQVSRPITGGRKVDL